MKSTQNLAFVALLAAGLAAPTCATTTRAQTVETGLVKLADSTIEYVSRGEGEAIVLLPGATLTAEYLDGLARALAKGGYRVVAVNFRGTGKSTGPSKGVSLQTFADDVAGVIQALNLAPSHIAGNEFGSRVARMLDASHPELARSVIVISSGGAVQPKAAAAHALDVLFNPKSTDAEVVEIMPRVVSNSTDAARLWASFKPSLDFKAAAIEGAAAAATPADAWWAPSGDTKYLILQGANDEIAPPKNGVQLQRDLGDRATLVNVPNAGHLLPLEQPEQTATQILDFIARVDK